jgi:hypothetical protein
LWFSASKQESHRAVALVLITGMNDTSRKDVKVMDLLPTPGARDGDRGPRSDQAVLENTGQRSLLDIVKLLAIESGELKVKLLPTPRVSDSKGVDNETEWARHSPGLAAMSFHLRSDDDQAGRDDEKLFSAPQAVEN